MLKTKDTLKYARDIINDFGDYRVLKITLQKMIIASLTKRERDVLMVIWNREPITSKNISDILDMSHAHVCNTLRNLSLYEMIIELKDPKSGSKIYRRKKL